MAYIPVVASWESSLVDGWSAYAGAVEDYYSWEPLSAGGFWKAYLETAVSGYVYGEGFISGDIQHYILYAISGDVQGIGYIFSDIVTREAIIISGECHGYGCIYSRFNFSRQKAVFPAIRREATYDWVDAPIAAIEYVDFSPNKVLNVISREDSLYENTAEFYLTETVYNNGTYFPITHYPYIDNASGKINYLITDYRSEGQNGKALFYQYELLFDAYTVEDGETVTLYKNNEVKIDKSQYIIQSSYDLLGKGAIRYGSTTWRPLDPSQTIHRIRILLPIDYSSREDFYTIDYNKSVYGARTPQKELVELTPLYQEGIDYIIVESGILLKSSKIPSKTQSLYIVKDPDDRIKPISIEPPSYQPDEVSSWRLRLNPGSVLTQSGIYNNEPERFYLLENNYLQKEPTKQYYAVTNVKPLSISENIVRFGQYPIYVDEDTYVYPNYTIGLYDKKDLTLTTDVGLVSIEVNGKARTDIKILSVDRKKGYFQLSEVLDQTDELEFNFYTDSTYYMVIENLELNPKVIGGDDLYHISGFMKGLGVAIKEYDPDDTHTHFPYIYNSDLPESERIYYEVPEANAISGYAYAYGAGNFWPICELNLNRLSTDMVKVTDARRIGGGLLDNSALNTWFAKPEHSGVSIREKDSYLGKAYYGGDPQSFGSTVVIHVPSGVLFTARNNWIASLSGVVDDAIEQVDRGTREFNYYLDQVIKRYISAGTDYILIPIDISGNFMKIENLTYDNTI